MSLEALADRVAVRVLVEFGTPEDMASGAVVGARRKLGPMAQRSQSEQSEALVSCAGAAILRALETVEEERTEERASP